MGQHCSLPGQLHCNSVATKQTRLYIPDDRLNCLTSLLNFHKVFRFLKCSFHGYIVIVHNSSVLHSGAYEDGEKEGRRKGEKEGGKEGGRRREGQICSYLCAHCVATGLSFLSRAILS